MMRWIVNLLSCLSVLLFSGIIYGWAPLYLILVAEGQYSELCPINSNNDDVIIAVDKDAAPATTCPEQDLKLGVMFTLGQFLLNFSSLPVGFMLDHTPKVAFYVIAGTINVMGLLLFACSDTKTGRDYFLLSYALMAFSGSMTMLGAFPTTFLLPQHQAALLAAISCLFDASSITFFVFYEVVLAIDSIDLTTIIRQRLFVGWAILSFVIFTCLCLLWAYLNRFDWNELDLSTIVGDGHGHGKGYTVDDPDREGLHVSEISALLVEGNESFSEMFGSPHQRLSSAAPSSSPRKDDMLLLSSSSARSDQKRRRSSRIQELQTKPLRKILSTFHFGVAAIFTSVSMLRINFYILTVDTFLLSLGDVNSRYAETFSWILPSGLIFVPIIDWTAKKLGVINTLRITNAIGIVFGMILLVPILSVQGLNFLLLTCYRAFVYAAISVFVAQTFGVGAMGRVFGSCAFIAALVSLAQSGMASVTQSTFDGNFYPTNCFNLFLAMIPTVAVEAYERWETS
jgi:hypothetical protein